MRHRRLLAAFAVAALIAAFAPAASGDTPQQPRLDPNDWEAPTVVTEGIDAVDGIQGLYDEDSTGLVPKTPFVQRYSLDQDHWEVWRCGGVTTSMSSILNTLNAATVDYFDDISGGVYEPVFVAGGTIAGDEACLQGFINDTYTPAGSPEGLLIVNTVTGYAGYSSPGIMCIDSNPNCTIGSTFPENRRYTVLGEPVLAWDSVIAHELGHSLQWPHSNSGIGDEYDNPLDLMSGNNTVGGWTEGDPYATLSYNRFQSGWVDDSDVVIASGGYQTVTLRPHDVAGTQLFAITTSQQGRFYVFGARITGGYDPIPSAWQGVEVYEVDYYCDDWAFGGGICPGIWRDHTQVPPSPNGVGHVLGVGESIELEGIAVTVTGVTATGYTIVADGGGATMPGSPGSPAATAGDGWVSVSWTAPGSDGGAPVTNYELQINDVTAASDSYADAGAATSKSVTGLSNGHGYRFRVRAENAAGVGAWSAWSATVTPLATLTPPDTFRDDDGSTFEASIEWLAAEGVTRGCNPPVNDMFCPNKAVTRGQMAAFLSRALGLTDRLDDPFTDDDGTTFEVDIEKLAAAGITMGCNPPINDMFCPNKPVTRQQMAAFLVRALGYTDAGNGDLFVDDDGSIFEDAIDKLATAGVTRGCNPPTNDRFCPNNVVTRGQMAAFLHRALG